MNLALDSLLVRRTMPSTARYIIPLEGGETNGAASPIASRKLFRGVVMLKSYLGFETLKNEINELPMAGRIYTKPKINKDNIVAAEFVVISSDEVEDYSKESGGLIPSQLAGRGYYSWLESPNFSDIILLKVEHVPNATLQEFIEAVFFYLENDAFID
ncbi:DUF7716 domain-containing protein [Methylomonas sp. YC3]